MATCTLVTFSGCKSGTQIPAAGSGGDSSSGGDSLTTAGGGGTGGTGTAGSPDSSVTVGSSTGSGRNDCPEEVAEPEFQRDPVDLIVVIDNSATMDAEIFSFEQHLNNSLIQPLLAQGLDHRVIMLSQHGAGPQQMCVQPPLSGTTNCNGPPVNVPEQFYHYSVNVQSHESLCTILSTLNGLDADDNNLAPGGWSDWLRPEALKVFVVLSDSGVSCLSDTMSFLDDGNTEAGGLQVAADFEPLLLAAAPEQFGTAINRHYIFYSMLGMAPKSANEPIPHYEPQEPSTTLVCAADGSEPGTGYQGLSKSTGALRFPACDTGSYPAFFLSLAGDLNDQALNQCRFRVPESSTISPYSAEVLFYPGDNGPLLSLYQVQTAEACGPMSFYLEGDEMRLCDSMCAMIKADPSARLEIRYQECPPPER